MNMNSKIGNLLLLLQIEREKRKKGRKANYLVGMICLKHLLGALFSAHRHPGSALGLLGFTSMT